MAGAISKAPQCQDLILIDFLRAVAVWSIRSSDRLRLFSATRAIFCTTWRHLFVAQYFGEMAWKNRKTHWHKAGSSAHKLSHVWRKSRRTAACLILCIANSEEVSQNLFSLELSTSIFAARVLFGPVKFHFARKSPMNLLSRYQDRQTESYMDRSIDR